MAAKQRAAGGPVKKDEKYLVGEKGTELFVPSTRSGRRRQAVQPTTTKRTKK